MKNVRTNGPIYDLRVNMLSFFNCILIINSYCKDILQIAFYYILFMI